MLQTCQDGPMNQQVCSNITGESIIEETLGFNMVILDSIETISDTNQF